MEIINDYTQNQFNERYFNDGKTRSSNYHYYRSYYIKNRERILNRNSIYEETYEKRKELSAISSRTIYYIKNGILDGSNRKHAKTVVAYMIIHNLKLKYIEYAKICIELMAMNL